MFRHARKLGLDGFMLKRLGVPYRSGPSPDWIKVQNLDSPAMGGTTVTGAAPPAGIRRGLWPDGIEQFSQPGASLGKLLFLQLIAPFS